MTIDLTQMLAAVGRMKGFGRSAGCLWIFVLFNYHEASQSWARFAMLMISAVLTTVVATWADNASVRRQMREH